MRELRRVTRALGNARDTDVQLAFLDRYAQAAGTAPEHRAGIERIRLILQNERQQEQARIHAALDSLEEAGVFRQLVPAVKHLTSGSSRPDTAGPRRLAAASATGALATLLSYDAAVQDPDDVAGHHALRIAAKKLRYTLEIFRPLYPDRLRPAIRQIRQLQELLGQIHDCDVWIVLLADVLLPGSVGNGSRAGGSPAGTLPAGEQAGVAAILADRRAARQELYGQLVVAWERYRNGSFPDQLRAAMGVPSPSPAPDALTAGERLGALGGLFPEGAGHARQVTRLALLLFDTLASLHGYGARERELLAYAGLLHDIGWVHGQQRHHTRSSRMILSDRTLPVRKRERAIIALLARYHRKGAPGPADRVFAGLKITDRQRVLALAPLLRIADGLDYTHADRVSSLSCTIKPDAVTCTLTCDGDCAIERGRALEKADLFEQVYATRFVIP